MLSLRAPAGLSALRERNFRRVFLASATSTIGDNVAPVAVAFAVLSVTRSPSALGIVLGARTLSLVVFILVGGVWADRISRHRLMIVADLLRFCSQATFAVLLITNAAEVWQLAVLQAINGMATALFQPASTGLIPQTVSPERLQDANALLSLTRSATSVAGPVIAGVLVATAGPGWAIAVDATTFAVSAAFLAGIELPGRVRRATSSFAGELAEGWREVQRLRWLWMMLLVFASFQILVLAPWMVLGPTLAERDLGGATSWAAVLACWGGGAVAGAALALRFHPRRVLVVGNTMACLISVPPILLGLGLPTVVVALAAVPAGASMVFSEVLWETAVQEHVPEESMSRVAAYDWLGSVALQPLALVIIGPIATGIGAPSTLVIGGMAMAALFLLAAASPPVKAVRSRSAAAAASPA